MVTTYSALIFSPSSLLLLRMLLLKTATVFGAGQAMQDASQRPGGKAGEASKGSNGAATSKLGQVLA